MLGQQWFTWFTTQYECYHIWSNFLVSFAWFLYRSCALSQSTTNILQCMMCAHKCSLITLIYVVIYIFMQSSVHVWAWNFFLFVHKPQWCYQHVHKQEYVQHTDNHISIDFYNIKQMLCYCSWLFMCCIDNCVADLCDSLQIGMKR